VAHKRKVEVVHTGKVGRPSAYSHETVKLICGLYSTGIGLTDAALAAGIPPSTAFAWLRESKANPNGPKGDFKRLLQEALGKSIAVAAQQVKKVDPKWWLRMQRKERWAEPTAKSELKVKSDVTVNYRHSLFEESIKRIAGLTPKKEEDEDGA
jgi:hypothetical protein